MTILPLIGAPVASPSAQPGGLIGLRFGAALAGTLVCLTTLSLRSHWGPTVAARYAFEGLETWPRSSFVAWLAC
jgi:hypothetical protein